MNRAEQLTSDIIEDIKKWNRPIRQKRRNSDQISGTTGVWYKWFNQMVLQFQKIKYSYNSNRRLTFNMIKSLGGGVRKWERWTRLTYYNIIKKEVDWVEKTIPFMKTFVVFNAEQSTLDGVDEVDIIKHHTANELSSLFMEVEDIELWVWWQPWYIPSDDKILMPHMWDFKSEEDYHGVLFHELSHSTGTESRLNRWIEQKKIFWDTDYSQEELIAEISANILNSKTWIDSDIVYNNSKAYIEWRLRALWNDPNMLIKAANKWQKSSDFIINTVDGYKAHREL